MKKLVKRFLFLILKVIFAFFLLSLFWVILYRFVDSPVSGMMIYKSITENNYSYESKWQDIEEIDASLPLAFISAEDQLFLTHNGFDVEAIKEAIEHNKESKRKRGASTISQQVAKNLFLFPTRSLFRKGLEAYYTFLVETLWPKKRIMEVYLNVVELGKGVYGVEEACLRYFGVSSKKISRSQAALVGTVLPNPLTFKLNQPTAYMQRRQAWILRQMNNLGGEQILKEL